MDLNEIYDGGKVTVIEEDQKAGTLKVRFPFCLADVQNGNGRKYPLAVLEREVNRVNKKINEGESVFGFCGHPGDGHGELDAVSHVIEKLSVTKGIGWGIAKILAESGPGKMLRTILKAGGKIGSSMRGRGTVTGGTVNEDYQLLGVDYVINPSFGKSVKFGKESIIENAKNSASEEAMRLCFQEAQDSGYVGSWDDFKKIHEDSKREPILDEDILSGKRR